jgi:hypothetical protein
MAPPAADEGEGEVHEPELKSLPSPLDVRRRRNRESMRRARIRQRAQKSEMQQQIRSLETQLAELVARAEAQRSSSADLGRLLLRTEQLRTQKRHLEAALTQFDAFRGKLRGETQQELERLAKLRHLEEDRDDQGANPRGTEEVPGRPSWMTLSKAQQVLRYAADMFAVNVQRTDAAVAMANSVLGWRDKRAVMDHTWAQFLLTKDFPHQTAESLVERTWNATVNVDQLRGMLKWTAGMKVRHQLSENAYVVCRELHLPNSNDADHPICYRYQLVIFRAETPNGFIISTQNINLDGGKEATARQMLDQQLLRRAGIPLVTMYGFQFERQHCERTGEVVGCRVKLAGRTSDGSLSYAHKVLNESLLSILRWENTYVGPILCITSSTGHAETLQQDQV